MARNRDLSKLLSTSNGKIAGANLDVSFENIADTGTEGTKVALGTTAQRGSTTGQFRYNSTTGKFEGRNANAFIALEATPTISSVDVTEVQSDAGGNQTFVITGTNFTSGDVASFVGNDNSVVIASSTTIDSATQITAVIAKNQFSNAKEPYDVKVTSQGGLSGVLENQINVDNAPAFTTAAGNLGSIASNATGNHFTIAATDPEGTAVTFAEVNATNISGAGLALSSAGVISGDPTDVNSDTTISFDVRATSNGKNTDRTFNIIVTPVPDGTSRALAVVVAANQNALTQLFAGEGTSNNHSTYNSPVVRWFKTTNTAGSTFLFPTIIANNGSNTWLMIQKNFVPHANKGANSDSNTSGGSVSANNSAHELSYGLINSSGGALVTTANLLGNAANQTPTLGTHHARVGAKSFGDTAFSSIMMYSRSGQANILNSGGNYTFNPITKLHLGQNPADGNYENNTWYNTDSGSNYMYFNTRMDAVDMDFMRNGLTPFNNVQHDRFNSPAEHEGTSWFRDGNNSGNGDYVNTNKDQQLEGNQGYSSDAANSGYGRISIWVR